MSDHVNVPKGEKFYECDECGRPLSSKSNLTRHYRTHTGEKPYECDICKKRFILKKNVEDHRRVHTGERPFTCDKCDLTFARRSALVRHFQTHSCIRERQFECGHCGRPFSFKCHLARHITNSHLVVNCKRRYRKRVTMTETIEPDTSAAKQSDSKPTGQSDCSDFVDSYTKEKTDEMEKLLETTAERETRSDQQNERDLFESVESIKLEEDIDEELADNFAGDEQLG